MGREDANLNFWENVCRDAEIFSKEELFTENKINDALKLWYKELTGKEKIYLEKYMSKGEISNSSNYFINKDLPISYLHFLQFCNISEMEIGERYFQFFDILKAREYTIAYVFPKWLNGVVSFTMNGGGYHYVFDMRQKSINGEYPIYTISSGNLGWDETEAFFLGNSFVEIVSAQTNIENLVNRR